MQTPYDLVVQLTAPNFPIGDSRVALNDFAEQLGWHISDRLDIPRLTDLATSHLLVEQGLENTAVISFLHKRWEDLGRADQKRILEVSYNNLVDWHIQIQPTEVRFIYNRMDPHQVVERYAIERDRIDQLRREAFEQITGKRYSPNLPALDDAVISTISRWKVNLGGELGADVPSSAFSALFNIIILARAIEDYRRRQVKDHSVVRALPDLIRPPLGSAANLPLRDILRTYLAEAVQGQIPAYLWNEDSLRVFDRLDPNTVYALLTDFYRNDYYNYDFSLISQHALSRIYERYVSILQVEESPQLSIPGIPRLPKETRNRAYGTYYTPPYIARFFAHYIREQFPRHMNKRLQVIDPACGSGVFLRTLLELECDPSQDGVTTEAIHAAFNNVTGLDIDENAAHAARLSLALLHLILANQFPEQLAIFSTETLGYYQTHPELHGGFDAVLANPPYVPLPEQPAEIRTLVMEILQESKIGRADLYLAFLRLAVGLLKPGGYGLFVIPHTFLIADSAQSTRAFLAETTWVRCLVDLSTIEVFPGVGTYTILVIFQKKPTSATIEPSATIVKCNDLPSRALADVLENRRIANKFYTIYDAPQTLFQQKRWVILPQVQLQIQDRFATLPTVADYLHVHLGLITGADDIFIVPTERALSLEPALFVPLLPDREMRAYAIMARPSLCVFYPYVNGHKIEEAELVSSFPRTWAYLQSHKGQLEQRPPVKTGRLPWWQPERPRFDYLLRPKIVSPHLVVVPRFSLDQAGEYAITRSPLLYPKEESVEQDLLRFFLAVLNSTPCYWHITQTSHKYQRGYVMLEPTTLLNTPVPDPVASDPGQRRALLNLVNRRLITQGAEAIHLEQQIDQLVADLYKLSAIEKRALGMEA